MKNRTLVLCRSSSCQETYEPVPLPQEIIDWLLSIEDLGPDYTAAELTEQDATWDVLRLCKAKPSLS